MTIGRPTASPFARLEAPALPAAKFRDRLRTASGEERAEVAFDGLRTLWFNTGTLCNLACAHCYIESSPTNDALAYLSEADIAPYLDEMDAMAPGGHEIGFTGGEPFLNRALPAMLEASLARGHRVLVLTNAMRPMRRHEAALLALRARHGDRLSLRVSLDHHTAVIHEAERGSGSWAPAIEGLCWLARNGFPVSVAGRRLAAETECCARSAFAALFARIGVQVDASDPGGLTLFPEMDAGIDIPEISRSCWDVLGRSPSAMMCASSRMVVKRRGEAPCVVACTLIPHDPGFEFGPRLSQATAPVRLNHPHCARFCVLGGASCSG